RRTRAKGRRRSSRSASRCSAGSSCARPVEAARPLPFATRVRGRQALARLPRFIRTEGRARGELEALMNTFDVVIVGSGINSLVCAAMLVRKGKRVCVLERNAVAGGCIRTEEITAPGFRHDLFSLSYPLFVMAPHYPLLKDELARGVRRFVSAASPTAVVTPEGRSLVLSQSRAENVAAMNALSAGDGDAYGAAMADIERDAALIFTILGQEPWSWPTAKT